MAEDEEEVPPVPVEVIADLHRVIEGSADVHTPYGATESLPVCSISGRELLAGPAALSRTGHGTCVGRVLPGMDIRIIRATDEPIARMSEAVVVPDGEIGEMVVRGGVVTRRLCKPPGGPVPRLLTPAYRGGGPRTMWMDAVR